MVHRAIDNSCERKYPYRTACKHFQPQEYMSSNRSERFIVPNHMPHDAPIPQHHDVKVFRIYAFTQRARTNVLSIGRVIEIENNGKSVQSASSISSAKIRISQFNVTSGSPTRPLIDPNDVETMLTMGIKRIKGNVQLQQVSPESCISMIAYDTFQTLTSNGFIVEGTEAEQSTIFGDFQVDDVLERRLVENDDEMYFISLIRVKTSSGDKIGWIPDDELTIEQQDIVEEFAKNRSSSRRAVKGTN